MRLTKISPIEHPFYNCIFLFFDLKVKLDREERSNYTLIIDVSDLGSPQQQTSTVLTVVVEDEDDHVPQFNRQRKTRYFLSISIKDYIVKL